MTCNLTAETLDLMKDSKPLAMPIGAVTQLTGISGHTLRKWESRYHAIEPVRTETGRRMYTQEQVQRLILLRDLIHQGYQISQLASMSDEVLAGMGEAPGEVARTVSLEQVTVVGQALPAMLEKEAPGANFRLVSEPADHWLSEPDLRAVRGEQALIVELPTLNARVVEQLLRLRRESVAHLLAVYGFASRRTLRMLLDGGVVCLKAPVSVAELLRNLEISDDRVQLFDELLHQAVPAHRFSAESIGQLAALSPKLKCECPNHIAQLLLDISAFEQYSLECEEVDPAERALHARLRLIAANARALFEQAMADVAANEGLELEEL